MASSRIPGQEEVLFCCSTPDCFHPTWREEKWDMPTSPHRSVTGCRRRRLPYLKQEDQREHGGNRVGGTVHEDGDLDVAFPVDEADLGQHQQQNERVIVRLPEMSQRKQQGVEHRREPPQPREAWQQVATVVEFLHKGSNHSITEQ